MNWNPPVFLLVLKYRYRIQYVDVRKFSLYIIEVCGTVFISAE